MVGVRGAGVEVVEREEKFGAFKGGETGVPL